MDRGMVGWMDDNRDGSQIHGMMATWIDGQRLNG